MPMTWTPEKNAQLLLGILDQLKDQNVKISLQKLAEYMGPDCTFKAVEGQMTKLKKQSAHTPANGATTSAPSTPAATPKKRRVNPKANTPSNTASPVKKAKVGKKDDTDEGDEVVERKILSEVKKDLEDLKE
ncbi:hypothetical protein BDV12DRAFT_48688 [Aspergillus spectabilis]